MAEEVEVSAPSSTEEELPAPVTTEEELSTEEKFGIIRYFTKSMLVAC